MKVVKDLKSWINGYSNVKAATEELELAFEYVRDEIVTEEEVDKMYKRTLHLIEELELKNMLRKEEDQLGAVLKVNAGAETTTTK